MKTFSTLTISIFLMLFTATPSKASNRNGDKEKIKVEKENGMFNGEYVSYYSNGQKKAEGLFMNNQRIGVWKVYDSSGQIRMSRNYENSFHYKLLLAKNAKGNDVTFPEKIDYTIVKNKDGYYDYPKLVQKDVAVSKRIWRTIEPNPTNNYLFDNNVLFNLLIKNIADTSKLTAYDIGSDEFTSTIKIEDINNKFLNKDFEVVGYKIKEDWFYDAKLQLSETRIIGLCPVIKNKTTGIQSDSFWIYYPELRPILLKENLTVTNNELISNMEDVFQYRNFSSTIYKEANIYDRNIADYKKGAEIKEVAETIERSLIEIEHDYWIYSTSK